MKEIIDKNLQKWVDLKLNRLPGLIQSDMTDAAQDPTEEWRWWFPVPSKVTDDEIKELEDKIKFQLPQSFKEFLKHKHFYEFQISDLRFCAHPSISWQVNLLELIFEGYPRELLLDKGYIPFATFSDFGLMCFDTHNKSDNNEYEIILWDHDNYTEYEYQFKNFSDMLHDLDQAEKNAG